MARPKTKNDLLVQTRENYDKLQALIGTMTKEEKRSDFIENDRDKNLKDILVHLYCWQKLLLDWLESNLGGRDKDFLPEGYNWRTYPQMNIEIQKDHESMALEEAEELLDKSHQRCLAYIEDFGEEELYSKAYYSWTKTTNVASYIISSTSSHYDWAIKKIRKNLKIYRNNK